MCGQLLLRSQSPDAQTLPSRSLDDDSTDSRRVTGRTFRQTVHLPRVVSVQYVLDFRPAARPTLAGVRWSRRSGAVAYVGRQTKSLCPFASEASRPGQSLRSVGAANRPRDSAALLSLTDAVDRTVEESVVYHNSPSTRHSRPARSHGSKSPQGGCFNAQFRMYSRKQVDSSWPTM